MRYFDLQFIADAANWVLALPLHEAPIDIWACKPIEGRSPIPFVVYSNGRRVDFNEAQSAVVASDRLAHVFRRLAPDDVQLIPASVAGDDGPWWVVNVVSRVDCIDHERSQITYYPLRHPKHPGKPRGVLRLVLDRSRIGDHHILRPQGWEVAAIVSETLKEAMEEAAITGAQFVCVTE